MDGRPRDCNNAPPRPGTRSGAPNNRENAHHIGRRHAHSLYHGLMGQLEVWNTRGARPPPERGKRLPNTTTTTATAEEHLVASKWVELLPGFCSQHIAGRHDAPNKWPPGVACKPWGTAATFPRQSLAGAQDAHCARLANSIRCSKFTEFRAGVAQAGLPRLGIRKPTSRRARGATILQDAFATYLQCAKWARAGGGTITTICTRSAPRNKRLQTNATTYCTPTPLTRLMLPGSCRRGYPPPLLCDRRRKPQPMPNGRHSGNRPPSDRCRCCPA